MRQLAIKTTLHSPEWIILYDSREFKSCSSKQKTFPHDTIIASIRHPGVHNHPLWRKILLTIGLWMLQCVLETPASELDTSGRRIVCDNRNLQVSLEIFGWLSKWVIITRTFSSPSCTFLPSRFWRNRSLGMRANQRPFSKKTYGNQARM